MVTHWGNESVGPRILKLGTIWEWLAPRSDHFTPGQRVPDTHWIGGWVGYRAVLNAVAKKENPFPAPAGNRNTAVQSVA